MNLPPHLPSNQTPSRPRTILYVIRFKVYEKLDRKGRAGGRGLHSSGGRGRDGHLKEGPDGGQGDAGGGGDGDPAKDELRAAEGLGVTVREVRRLRYSRPEPGSSLGEGERKTFLSYFLRLWWVAVYHIR